jgi:hypothetical protein
VIHLKTGVKLALLRPQVVLGLCVAEGVWGDWPLWVTSASDGVHTRNSAHYEGRAVDLRTKAVPHVVSKISALKLALGAEWFLLHEAIGQANEHLHLEWRPAVPAPVVTA